MAAFSSYHHHPHYYSTSNAKNNNTINFIASESAEPINSLDCSSGSSSLFASPQPQILKNPSNNSSSLVLMESRKKRKNPHGTSFEPARLVLQEDAKSKNRKQAADQERRGGGGEEEEAKPTTEEAPPTGYIHVRARRGQATDSHSLAERVRREKIRERMNLLQGLVPGCDKITGKALMLDEIINYVQSLQNQVAFLSMKLASMNPLPSDSGLDGQIDQAQRIVSNNSIIMASQQESISPSMGNCVREQQAVAVEEAMMGSCWPIMESNIPSPPLLTHDGHDPSKTMGPLLHHRHHQDDGVQVAAAAKKRQELLSQLVFHSLWPFQ